MKRILRSVDDKWIKYQTPYFDVKTFLFASFDLRKWQRVLFHLINVWNRYHHHDNMRTLLGATFFIPFDSVGVFSSSNSSSQTTLSSYPYLISHIRHSKACSIFCTQMVSSNFGTNVSSAFRCIIHFGSFLGGSCDNGYTASRTHLGYFFLNQEVIDGPTPDRFITGRCNHYFLFGEENGIMYRLVWSLNVYKQSSLFERFHTLAVLSSDTETKWLEFTKASPRTKEMPPSIPWWNVL